MIFRKAVRPIKFSGNGQKSPHKFDKTHSRSVTLMQRFKAFERKPLLYVPALSG